jgi:predicted dehydrogenase
MTTLRAAIIGPGRIASTYDDEIPMHRPAEFFTGEQRHAGLYTILPVNHAKSYLTTPGYELVAVAGRGQERLDAFTQRWGVTGYSDVNRMLEETKPDVVSVCTQSASKAEVTIAAAKAGVKAVIVEKAMATSVAEADAMVAACEASGTLLVVDHPWRFTPVVREVKARIEQGEIGQLGSIAGWNRGGALHGGTHVLDLFRFIAGDIEEIYAYGPVADEWSDRNANSLVKFTSGVAGFFDGLNPALGGFDIRGDRGQISLSTHVGDGWLVQAELLDRGSKRAYPYVVTRTPLGGEKIELSTTQRVIAETRDALLHDAPVISSGRDGAAALEACIATLISAKEGRAVKLPLTDRSVVVPNR